MGIHHTIVWKKIKCPLPVFHIQVIMVNNGNMLAILTKVSLYKKDFSHCMYECILIQEHLAE